MRARERGEKERVDSNALQTWETMEGELNANVMSR